MRSAVLLLLPISLTALLPAEARIYSADDQTAAALHSTELRLEAERSTADTLRTQLDQARTDAENRVESVRTASDALTHQLRTELTAALDAQRGAEELAKSKDALIAGIEARPVVNPVPVPVPDDHVALVRHEETIREVRGTSSELARMNSMQADIRHLVIDARAHDQRRAALAAERADREALAQRLQVATAVMSLLQFALIGLLVMHRRRRW